MCGIVLFMLHFVSNWHFSRTEADDTLSKETQFEHWPFDNFMSQLWRVKQALPNWEHWFLFRGEWASTRSRTSRSRIFIFTQSLGEIKKTKPWRCHKKPPSVNHGGKLLFFWKFSDIAVSILQYYIALPSSFKTSMFGGFFLTENINCKKR